MFAAPPERRPPAARDPLALMNLVYDIDDDEGGMRLSGDDEFDVGNWEVGQTLFANWWWALDRAVIAQSNALRRRRGAERLRLGPGVAVA